MGVDFGVVIPSWGPYGEPQTLRDLIREAERLGYSTAWFGDHLLVPEYATALTPPSWYEALTCCLVGMGLTTRLRFGTDVLVLPYRDPRLLAKMASTADRLSGGRLTLGVGVGFLRGEFEALGVDRAQRGDITDEYLQVLRRLWETDGPVSFQGRFLHFGPVHAAPRPLQRPLPLWIGGNAPRALERAARLGDGWHPLFLTADEYARGRAAIETRRGARGAEGFRFSYSCPETRIVDGGSAERRESHGYAQMGELPADYDYAPPIPRSPSGRPYFVGTATELAEDVATLARAGVEHFALRFWSGDPSVGPDRVIGQMRRFAGQVAPRFR